MYYDIKIISCNILADDSEFLATAEFTAAATAVIVQTPQNRLTSLIEKLCARAAAARVYVVRYSFRFTRGATDDDVAPRRGRRFRLVSALAGIQCVLAVGTCTHTYVA